MGTKGTWKRPTQVSEAEAQASWDRIFGPGSAWERSRRRPTTDLGSHFIRGILEAAAEQQAQIAEPPATE